MNFALILVLATFVTGLVWFGWWLVGGTARDQEEPTVVEWCRAFFPVLLIVLVLRSFVAEPFRIPSASMMPTLKVGDFILVNKFAYGLRLPVLETKFLEVGSPERGEVAVFRYPPAPQVDYIKRVAAVPGDEVQYRDQKLYVNGEKVARTELGPYEPREIDAGQNRVRPGSLLWEEKLNDHAYRILLAPSSEYRSVPSGSGGQRQQNLREELHEGVEIPEGEYLMLGDNRDNSADSRHWGLVPEDHLRGRAMFIWMSWELFNASPDWGRFGKGIQ